MNIGSNTKITGCIFTSNLDTVWGGAIYTIGSTNIIIEKCTFIDNISYNVAGAIFLEISWSISIISCTFRGNRALGGALYAQSSHDITFDSCIFDSNIGGAIYLTNNMADVSQNSILIFNSTFVNNSAETDGGAIYFGKGISFVGIFLSVFSGNIAKSGSDGAIFMDSTNHHISIGGAVPLRYFDDNCRSVTGHGWARPQTGEGVMRTTSLGIHLQTWVAARVGGESVTLS